MPGQLEARASRIPAALLALWLLAPSAGAARSDEATPSARPDDGYGDAAARADVAGTCSRIGAKLASVSPAECTGAGLSASAARSVEGSPILVKTYPPLAGREPRARVLLIGGIHGDEYSSVTIVFKWMHILDAHHSGLFHWRIAPLMNPDGLLREHSQRMNARGVDLNRNFPTPNWAQESVEYWVRRTGRNPRRYPGPQPLSEPESRWLHREIARFRPEVIVSVHAPHGIVDFDGPPAAPRRLGRLYLKLLGTYPGSLGNYAGVQGGIPVVTIELPSAGIMPPAAEIDRIWTDLVGWLLERFPAREPMHTADARGL